VFCIWKEQPSIILTINNSNILNVVKKLQEKDKQKDDFLAIVTHDLKTPLNSIIALTEMCCLSEDINELKKTIDIVRKNSYLLLSITNDVLDYSQIKNGTLKLVPSDIYLNELLDELVDVFEIQLKLKGLRLRSELKLESMAICNDVNRLK